GHKAGVDAVRAVIEVCAREGVEVLTLFAFSSENWARPEAEVGALMELFLLALHREVRKLRDNDIRLNIIGDRSRFAPKLQQAMLDAAALTAECGGLQLLVAANYGGQWDVTQSTRALAQEAADGLIDPGAITADDITARLSTAGLPLPDLCIRTGGE